MAEPTLREMFLNQKLVKRDIAAFGASLSPPITLDPDQQIKEQMVDQLVEHIAQHRIHVGFDRDGRPIHGNANANQGAGEEDEGRPDEPGHELLAAATEAIDAMAKVAVDATYPLRVTIGGAEFVREEADAPVVYALPKPDPGDLGPAVLIARVSIPGIRDKGRRDLGAMLGASFNSTNGCRVQALGDSWNIHGPEAVRDELFADVVALLGSSFGYPDPQKYVKRLGAGG